MKRITALMLAALILLPSCRTERIDYSETEAAPLPEYNKDVMSGGLDVFMESAKPGDEVVIDLWISEECLDEETLIDYLEDKYYISKELSAAIENLDYTVIDEAAKERFENTNNYYGAPKYEDNVEQAREDVMLAYKAVKERAINEFYRDIVNGLPFRPGDRSRHSTDPRNVVEYKATAEEVCELSKAEHVASIVGRSETPVIVPERIKNAVTFTETYGDLQFSISFDREAYSYGDTINMQVLIHNGGDETVKFNIINETGTDGIGGPNLISGFYFIRSGFYENGTERSDVSCNYGYDYNSNTFRPDGELEPGQTFGKTYAFTPHKTYEFMKAPVSEDSEWVIKTAFEIIEGDDTVEYVHEFPVLRTGS